MTQRDGGRRRTRLSRQDSSNDGRLVGGLVRLGVPRLLAEDGRETRVLIYRPIKPGLGDVSVARLRPITLDRFSGRLLSPGGRTRNTALSPAASASPPRVPAPRIQPPTASQLAPLLEAASDRDPDLAVFVMRSGATGARRSELVALRWCDIDLERSVVTLARAIVVGPDGMRRRTRRRTKSDGSASIAPRTMR
jgi:integrase